MGVCLIFVFNFLILFKGDGVLFSYLNGSYLERVCLIILKVMVFCLAISSKMLQGLVVRNLLVLSRNSVLEHVLPKETDQHTDG